MEKKKKAKQYKTIVNKNIKIDLNPTSLDEGGSFDVLVAILSYVSFLHIQTLNSILYKWDHITCYLLIQGFKLLFKMFFWSVLGGAASYSWKS